MPPADPLFQSDLFGPLPTPLQPVRPSGPQPATLPRSTFELADRLSAAFGDLLWLGTSSWHFPGWAGHVWDAPCSDVLLSRHGLPAYAAHPLLRTVSLDRAFYRVVGVDEYAGLAAQVRGRGRFRFVVKAHALLTDAQERDPATGRATRPNPHFLDPELGVRQVLLPAQDGLGETMGVLVLQLSPLPARWLDDPEALWQRLDRLLAALAAHRRDPVLLAVEVRDAPLLSPGLATCLRAHGVRYTLGVHSRLPDVAEQLPLLRATWPGGLVCRWNLQRGQRYAEARDAWSPFDRLQAEDPLTRDALARVAVATLRAGHPVFITINNKAEGCAPASVLAMARAMAAQAGLETEGG